MRKRVALAIIGGALIGTIVMAACDLRSRQKTSADVFSSANESVAPETSSLSADQRSSAVTLEEFGDYQCPPCGALHPELKRIKQEYGQRVRFMFRNLPLTKIHANALAAAQAAEAARLQGRFWEMHDRLFESQTGWTTDNDPRPVFLKYAHDIGLDLDRFAQDLDGPQVQERLVADQRLAESLGLDSTPTIIIDGRQLRPEATTPEGIRKGLELMLTKKAAP
ncbi:MAG TPA: thioredoxin domain-containing protein [Pyrinomonadaceae bacterium]|nr:thioredoxin domain-containing protein [Pyrinomonadaceae bacterium]